MGAGDLGCDLCERGVGLATEEIALVGDIDDVASALPVSHEAPTGAQLWPKGFGVLYVDGNKVMPHLVPVNMDGSFVFDGRVWK